MVYENISSVRKARAEKGDERVTIRERQGAVPNQLDLTREEWVKIGRMAGWISDDGDEIYEDAGEELADKVREMREKDSEELTELDDIGEEEEEQMELTISYQYPLENPFWEGEEVLEFDEEPKRASDMREAVAQHLREEHDEDGITDVGVKIHGVEEWTVECPSCGEEVFWAGFNNEYVGKEYGDHERGCRLYNKGGYDLKDEVDEDE